MLCPNCNSPLTEGAKFCTACGAPAPAEPAPEPVEVAPVSADTATPAPVAPAPVYQAPAPISQAPVQITEKDLPEQYRPLSAWAYFGLTILYSIPLVGFVFLIVFSFNSSNINRRNFTRSYWCALLIVAIVAVVILALGGLGAILGSRY